MLLLDVPRLHLLCSMVRSRVTAGHVPLDTDGTPEYTIQQPRFSVLEVLLGADPSFLQVRCGWVGGLRGHVAIAVVLAKRAHRSVPQPSEGS